MRMTSNLAISLLLEPSNFNMSLVPKEEEEQLS